MPSSIADAQTAFQAHRQEVQSQLASTYQDVSGFGDEAFSSDEAFTAGLSLRRRSMLLDVNVRADNQPYATRLNVAESIAGPALQRLPEP